MFDLKKPIPGTDAERVDWLLCMMENPILAIMSHNCIPIHTKDYFCITSEAARLFDSLSDIFPSASVLDCYAERIAIHIAEKPARKPCVVTLQVAQWACYYVLMNFAPYAQASFCVDNPEAPTAFVLNPKVTA